MAYLTIALPEAVKDYLDRAARNSHRRSYLRESRSGELAWRRETVA
jgi:hypothetical protein